MRPQPTTLVTPKQATDNREWFVIDVADCSLGRAATDIASILRGKHKPTYTPNVDTGDHVVVINAAKVSLTGNKLSQKMYRYHTGYIGGLVEKRADKVMAEEPERAVKQAVKGMLPKGRLGRKMFKKLKVFSSAEHLHAAQQPTQWVVGSGRK